MMLLLVANVFAQNPTQAELRTLVLDSLELREAKANEILLEHQILAVHKQAQEDIALVRENGAIRVEYLQHEVTSLEAIGLALDKDNTQLRRKDAVHKAQKKVLATALVVVTAIAAVGIVL